uniref:BTB domain-containing protein n=1 Tax=Glossina austeni TaxID=7395 RepID=A0A1A9VIK0_GLOAU
MDALVYLKHNMVAQSVDESLLLSIQENWKMVNNGNLVLRLLNKMRIEQKEIQKGCCKLQHVDAIAVNVLVEYMYTGMITIANHNVDGLLHASHLFQIEWVKQRCEQFLERNSNAPVKGAKGESTQNSYRASTSNRKRTSIAKLRMLRSNRVENKPLSTTETQESSRSGQSLLSKKTELRKSPSTLKYRRALQQITEEKSKKSYKIIWKKPSMGIMGQSSESFKHTLSKIRSMQGRDRRSLRATRKREAPKDPEESPHSPLTKKNDLHPLSREKEDIRHLSTIELTATILNFRNNILQFFKRFLKQMR